MGKRAYQSAKSRKVRKIAKKMKFNRGASKYMQNKNCYMPRHILATAVTYGKKQQIKKGTFFYKTYTTTM
ncbi:hypothetical protein [Listeria kieliensis]|uniref:Uncharacterized protein n=1 Tax=Listeria kieliensis TaxID=1621700 RepID=A0A3D8TQ54_9LIST|nr:hypothetical protein [Listeria kieliensis]RDX00734.1 hypothetical protein UR08_07050 [Listeria kieliensis]